MIVSELFESLSFGELSNLSIGEEGSGTIEPSQRPRIMRFLNQSLREIHARMPAGSRFMRIALVEGRREYPLRPQYAVSHDEVYDYQDRFIKDDATHPFRGEVLKILGVRWTNDKEDPKAPKSSPYWGIGDRLGADLSLNARMIPDGIRVMGHDTLFVTDPKPGLELEVEYQVLPEALPLDPTKVELVGKTNFSDQSLGGWNSGVNGPGFSIVSAPSSPGGDWYGESHVLSVGGVAGESRNSLQEAPWRRVPSGLHRVRMRGRVMIPNTGFADVMAGITVEKQDGSFALVQDRVAKPGDGIAAFDQMMEIPETGVRYVPTVTNNDDAFSTPASQFYLGRLSVEATPLYERIEIAPFLQEALELRIAHRVYDAMNGEANIAKARLLSKRFEEQLAHARSDDLMQMSGNEPDPKLINRGFP